MKNMFLLIVISVLLVTLGFGQAPTPSSNTEEGSIKGCLGGSDGNYTVAEDGTTQTFKITSSTVDLKAHVGHDVEVIGQKANADTSSGASDNSVVVTGVNMISDQCTTTSTATAGTPAVADPSPTVTAGTPAVTDPSPTATAGSSAVTASTPAAADQIPPATAGSPAVTDSTPSATASTPAATDQTPAATASTPAVADPTPTPTASAPMMASASAPENNNQLPATATPLPLLGLLGLGLLATGLLSWTSRTN